MTLSRKTDATKGAKSEIELAAREADVADEVTSGEKVSEDGSELLGLWWAEANTNAITGGDAGFEEMPCADTAALNAEAEEEEIVPIFAQRPS